MPPVIVVDDVHKSFGQQQVLGGASLTVNEGETVALMGRSGSGKSVLMKLIIGLAPPDEGRVLVDGEDVAQMSRAQRPEYWKKLGILFQGGALFDSMTVYDNVAFPLRERLHEREREVRVHVAEALERVGLGHAAHQLPSELSGGMQKRVALARATVLKPRIMLYDEPTAGLDPLKTEDVVEALQRAQRELGATALIITSDLAVAFSVANRVAFLSRGRIALEAPPEELRTSRHPDVLAFVHAWVERQAGAGDRHAPL